MAQEIPRLPNLPIDHARPIKVVCIGAGYSGILAGIRLPQAIQNLHLTIYEKNDDIGGTWYENRYETVVTTNLVQRRLTMALTDTRELLAVGNT